MGEFSDKHSQICSHFFGVLVIVGFLFSAAIGHQCSHGHGGHHDNHHHHDVHDEDLGSIKENERPRTLLPEEIAEEEDLKMMWAQDDNHVHDFGHGHNGHKHDVDLSGRGLWIHAMACSLLVSFASLICLILLPLIFIQGKPSKAIVDSLALFGAGAMLGDAFLHQLPHAFDMEAYYLLEQKLGI